MPLKLGRLNKPKVLVIVVTAAATAVVMVLMTYWL